MRKREGRMEGERKKGKILEDILVFQLQLTFILILAA